MKKQQMKQGRASKSSAAFALSQFDKRKAEKERLLLACHAHLRLSHNITHLLAIFRDPNPTQTEIFEEAAALHMAKAEKLKAAFRLKHGQAEFVRLFGHVANSNFTTK